MGSSTTHCAWLACCQNTGVWGQPGPWCKSEKAQFMGNPRLWEIPVYGKSPFMGRGRLQAATKRYSSLPGAVAQHLKLRENAAWIHAMQPNPHYCQGILPHVTGHNDSICACSLSHVCAFDLLFGNRKLRERSTILKAGKQVYSKLLKHF
jgi:hypothetical protein